LLLHHRVLGLKRQRRINKSTKISPWDSDHDPLIFGHYPVLPSFCLVDDLEICRSCPFILEIRPLINWEYLQFALLDRLKNVQSFRKVANDLEERHQFPIGKT